MAEVTCAICLEHIDESSSDQHTIDQCGHTFHASCLIKWTINPANGSTCPTCRSTPPTIGFFTARARASHLRRTVARRKNAPSDLMKLVRSVQSAEAAARKASHTASFLRKKHKKILQIVRKARSDKWRADRKVHDAILVLGCYSSTTIPLPALAAGTRW